MDMELEPRVKSLPYKVKGMSRESPSQKALHVLDIDLRTHWSTGTNTKEWILLELDEPCLLSHLRIYNKSVIEWEIAVGLRYKPEAFVKVRPRCEAPRRDMMYPMNYTPCRYVRISCLRGNPIAIFYIQLIGVSVTGLEPEFQPLVNHLLPHILAHKQDAYNMHLQLLQDMTKRLWPFLPQLEADLTCFSEAAESNTRFLALIAGPLYPILHTVRERETARPSSNFHDSDASKSTQSTTLTVSSNFEAQSRRTRSSSPFVQPSASSTVFRPDMVFILLRRASRDSHLGTVCRTASRILEKLVEPCLSLEAPISDYDLTSSVSDETAKAEASNHVLLADYSSLFGEEFRVPDDQLDSNYLNVLDVGEVEEGILHVLCACASQPILCRKLADNKSEFCSVLPLVQALLPALRPPVSSHDHLDDSFLQWRQPFVQQALSQIVASSSLSVYRPLLHACAGYLSSFSQSHAKAACVLIDLCTGPLAPWISTVIAKVDLTIELLEELLGTIHGARNSITRAEAALKYIILALSGHMDDVLARYKEAKHKILFLLEMLGPFLEPAITTLKNTIAFGDVSAIFLKKQEHTCALALNVIRTAMKKPAVLPSLESEWRRGSVTPSVLLSILGPNMPLPPEIDLCKCPISRDANQEYSDGITEVNESTVKLDVFEDAAVLFAPLELKNMHLRNLSNHFEGQSVDRKNAESNSISATIEGKDAVKSDGNNQSKTDLVLDVGFAVEYFNLQADCLHLMNHRDCELRASEFLRLAFELNAQHDITPEGHDTSIDAFLLAAECYVNPFFMMAFRDNSKIMDQINISGPRIRQKYDTAELKKVCGKKNSELEVISHLERKRDLTVLQILVEAAELDREYCRRLSDGEECSYDTEGDDQGIKIASDKQTADAVTLVRQHQALLCHFLIKRLRKDQHSMHEILMQSLLFLLHSGTELSCSPDNVIDIILGSAEYLNLLLSSFYYQLKDGNLQLGPDRIYGVQRRWVLLQSIVIASSCGGEGPEFTINSQDRFQYRSLILPSSWMQKIPLFSSHSCPLVRFLGWMAVSCYAKQYLKERLFLASDLEELTCMLSIFSDELAQVDDIVTEDFKKLRQTETQNDILAQKEFKLPHQSDSEMYFHVLYPDLHKFFPNMKKQFESFGDVILEAVGLQLRSLPSSTVPDVLCWFSDLCLWPFLENGKERLCTGSTSDTLKGYVAKNAKAIILYVLEAILVEHMEEMVPEIPRVVHVLASLCRASYCDVDFLDSVLCLLKPLISYALSKIPDNGKLLTDESSCLNFESLCFGELFINLRYRNGSADATAEKLYRGALTIFIMGAVFPDLSFARRKEILLSLMFWADFTIVEPASSFYDYLCAFQKIMESCGLVLIHTLRDFGIPISVKQPHSSSATSPPSFDDNSEFSCFLDDVCHFSPAKFTDQNEEETEDIGLPNKQYSVSSAEEIVEICNIMEDLIAKLNPNTDHCWKIHHQLTKKLTLLSSRCCLLARCLASVAQAVHINSQISFENVSPPYSNDHNSVHWRSGLEGLVGAVITLQENNCWDVASTMLDYLLGLPPCFCLDFVLGTICSGIKFFSCHAPRISWRLQTDKWLSILFKRGIGNLLEDAVSLVDLFCTMLAHPEPEQRSVALQHLSRVVGQDANDEAEMLPNTLREKLATSDLAFCVPESVLSLIISRTWDRVVVLSSSDPSMLLRLRAISLLITYVPFTDCEKLQSFLGAADCVLHGLGKLSYSLYESPLTQLSVALLASACLHSPAEDIALIPQNVWRNLEMLALPNSGGKLGDTEKKACQALCKLRTQGDDAKVVLKEVLSSTSASKQSDANFGTTRESILQVLPNLTSVQRYFDMFSKRIDREAMELEEAEIEMDLLQKGRAMQEFSGDFRKETHQLPVLSTQMKDNYHLQRIKDGIHTLEKSRLREEIVARRQKKLLVRHTRQKYLEEAALREAELVQELDRERIIEVEREIERQRVLELERAKTRELRYNLDMEKERQTQRELERELEQAESGLRPLRREFSSTTTSTNSRSRDRFREREDERSGGQEGKSRSSSRGREGGLATTTVGGSRASTILQPHERGSSYEDSYEFGDTGSVGDPDLDGLASFGSKLGTSRGSKSRQIVERRERDGSRREGKWERKH